MEVGSHYGEDTVKLLNFFQPERIFCFEPDPRNIIMMKKYIKDSRISLFEYALSSQDSNLVKFYQGYSPVVNKKNLDKYNWIDKNEYINLKLNSSGASSLKQGHRLVKNSSVINIKTKRFDTWFVEQNIDLVDLIWIDVQGAEQDVIEGLGDFRKNINFIWIEYGEIDYEGAITRNQTIDLLSDLNFTCIEDHSDQGKKGNLLFWRN